MKKTDNTFTPAFGLKNGHLQTLYPAFFRQCKPLNMDIETFELDDGDFVQCHWVNQPEKNSNTPIVVLFHGLEGSYKSPYIQGMMHALDHSGYSCVLMHFRGCSGKINRQPRAYHSGDTADARAWIENLTKRFAHNPLFAIGYSLGGNMLLKLLGEWKKDSPFKAAVSISAPMQLDISANTINKGFSKIYQRHLLEHLKFSLVQKYQYHDMKKLIGMDENDVRNIPTIWAFDDLYTAKIHGFQTAKNYYKCSSAKQYVKDIQTPTLIIHALDDPFMSKEILPSKNELSQSITLEVYDHGGHVGFVSGNLLNPQYWLEERIVEYFKHIRNDSNILQQKEYHL